VATAARSDVERQKVIDQHWDDRQGTLMARMAAVVAAQRATMAGEFDARYALRQSLIDLASISELLAADLPAPSLERARSGRHLGLVTKYRVDADA
jgi:hypothetical protein